MVVSLTPSVGLILAVAFKPRFARAEFARRVMRRLKSGVATRRIQSTEAFPAFKGRAKFRPTPRVENHQQGATRNCVATLFLGLFGKLGARDYTHIAIHAIHSTCESTQIQLSSH